MDFVAHRINTIEELEKIPSNYGVEVDLRDHGNRLILSHDPFCNGENFDDFLKHYHHDLLILNIKSERIEHRVLELLKKYAIKKYFFLDSSFPMIYLLSKSGEKNIALRYSEFEGLDTIMNMKNRVDWVWVDCFSTLPINKEIFQTLKEAGYKLCLVSPELQGRPEDISSYAKKLSHENIIFDAVCTKFYNIEKWNCLT